MCVRSAPKETHAQQHMHQLSLPWLPGGDNTAVAERFPVTLGSDGVLSLVFAATVNLATVSGIEVGELLAMKIYELQQPAALCMLNVPILQACSAPLTGNGMETLRQVLLPAVLRINSGAPQSFQDGDNNTWAADFGNIGALCLLCVTWCAGPACCLQLQPSCEHHSG